MKGYWNHEEDTQARLVELNGMTYYQTGDVCKYLLDGNLFFIGRKDNEVNIAGYRIHLNEVQRVINSVQNVHSSEVVVINSKYGEKILAAAVLLKNGAYRQRDRESTLINERLAAELPNYMMPRHVTILDKFPLLSSGKPNRKTLASILTQRITNSEGEEYNDQDRNRISDG